MSTWRTAMALGVTLVAVCGARAQAADHTIKGKGFLLRKGPTGNAQQRSFVGLAREQNSLDAIVGDPTLLGASLAVIARGASPSQQLFALPAAGWRAIGSVGYRYSNGTTGGAVRRVIVKKGLSGTFVLKVLIRGGDGPFDVLPPDPGTDGGYVLAINGGDSYCTSFGGAAGGRIVRNTDRVFRIVNPTAEAEACPTCPPALASAKVIATAADQIDGPLSRGRPGDILLANDRIQVVIQQPGRVMFGIGPYGGNIIDADLQRCDIGERDNFEEMTPLINIENTANYTSVSVLNDGSDGNPALVRATGVDDLLDLVNASSVVAGFGFVFPPTADDRDLPVDVQTDYILETGKPYVRLETTLTNTGALPLDIFFGEYLNGSGQVELFQSGWGFGEPLVTTGCPATTQKACAAGMCDLCDFVAYSGEDLGGGVSYGYIHGINDSTTFSTSGVTVPLLGRSVVLTLIGVETPNFHMNPASTPGDAVTITRYFAVADGSVAALEGIRNEIRGVTTGTLTGTVTSGGSPVANADVAVIAPSYSGGTSTNVVNHFRTAADGTYSGTLAPGTYTVRANKDGRLFGTPDPANVTITAATTTTQDFDLPAPGRLRVTVTDESSERIVAKVQLVGFDPSPNPIVTQSIAGLINNNTAVFGEAFEDGLAYGIAHVSFAYCATCTPQLGDTGEVEVEPGTYQLSVSHGPRYSAFSAPVTITAGALTTVPAQIARVIDTPDFIGGDFHVHSIQSPDSEVTLEERVITELAEGMDFFTPSDHDIRADFAPAIASLGVSSLISTATSAEITTFDYGHFNSWPVTLNPALVNGGGLDWGRAGVAPGADFPSLGSYNLTPQEIFDLAHDPIFEPLDNLIQINHIASFFGAGGLDIDTAEGGVGPPTSHTAHATRRLNPAAGNLFGDGFDALEVWIGTDGRSGDLTTFVGLNLGDWVNMLNQGILRSGVADSDTHQRRSTQINARTWVASTVTDPSMLAAEAENLAANVVSGRATGANAPFVTVTANAASTGQTAGLALPLPTLISTTNNAVDVTVSVKSPRWAEFDKIQVLVNAKPQPHDHDGNASTRMRYRALPDNLCVVASGCYEQTVTPTEVDVFPLIPGAKRLEATAVFNLTGLTQDAWILVLVRGTDNVSRPLFPVLPNSLQQAGNTTLAQLTDGNLNELGVLSLAFTNPLYVNVNGGAWTAPGVMLTP